MENSICGSFPGEPHGTRWCCSFAACFATPASRGCWRRPLIWAAGEPWKWWPSSQMHSLTSPAWTSMTRRCLKVCLGMPWWLVYGEPPGKCWPERKNMLVVRGWFVEIGLYSEEWGVVWQRPVVFKLGTVVLWPSKSEGFLHVYLQ